MSEILLSQCVAQVESAGNLLAMRYEPDATPTPASIQAVRSHAVGGYMDFTTARMVASTSWGMYQIMGFNLWSTLHYSKTLTEYLTSARDQRAAFEKFINKIGFTDGPFALMSITEVDKFAGLYNGSQVYAASLQNAYQYLKARA